MDVELNRAEASSSERGLVETERIQLAVLRFTPPVISEY
jgi:hypothetical protein